MSSTPGIGCVSRNTFLLSPLIEVYTHSHLLACFSTTTIPTHHGVGSVTFEITPAFSIRSSSSLTLAVINMGTFCGVNRACGWAPSRNLMEYSSSRFPRPLKRDGYCAGQSCSSVMLVASILETSLRTVIAGRPNRLVRSPQMTYTGSFTCLSLLERVPVNCPRTFIGRPAGPYKILVCFVRVTPLRLLKVHSDSAVTSAPVSILKWMSLPVLV